MSAADAAKAKALKESKFKELASKRTQKVLDTMDVLGNCFSRANYVYTDEQTEKIFEALSAKVDELRSLTQPDAPKASNSFSL